CTLLSSSNNSPDVW
nr:immunoglobulin heavy chain junction region [Macaca mulatta]MOX37982.1 immunoglobulin heavy chain junction region [Macaca mulatta]MOX38093.1 immunoglobulin heavy chain junction region [Macaca mulatta]MOX38147.1 immunoglobulin heavy chain junction region [Macaca mulatta]MOX38393.1 immunoglobulin heavy chain junction region [Macaca mulatta]